MSSHDLQSSRQIWTEYWRGGRQGCLTDEAPPSARDCVERLWRSWFQQQPPGARILDLACGAGDVARIALGVGAERQLRFTIEGVDLADIEQAMHTQSSTSGTTMRLRGGINIGRLPFPDGSFDLAVSQFGIEYANPAASCAELARVLKPGGGGLFLLHHKESAISAAAAARLRAFASVIGDGVILERARSVYQAIGARSAERIVASRLAEFRQNLRTATETHVTKFGWEENLREMLTFLADLARNPGLFDPFDAQRRLSSAQDMIGAWRSRQEAQLAAALNESGITAFKETSRRAGLKPLDSRLVRDPVDNTVLAWELTFATTRQQTG